MSRMLTTHLGKILLGVALVWSITAAIISPLKTMELTGAAPAKDKEPDVYVSFDPKVLTSAKVENYFPNKPVDPGTDREVWIRVKKVEPYKEIELAIPPANIARPPQLLPAPGPSLEGAHTLPRWGDELPALAAPKDVKDPKKPDPVPPKPPK